MAKIQKLTVIEKASRDKSDHKPINPNQRAILIIRHDPTGIVIKTRGWTLNQVLAIMEWKANDVWATFARPYAKDRGAYKLTGSPRLDHNLAKLNPPEE